MKYFVTVHVLSATTKLGKLLADAVLRRYNNALVFHEEASAIPEFIADEMALITLKNKRLKPMQVKKHGFTPSGVLPRYAPATIWATTEAGAKAFTDNRPFTITITPVLKDYTEKGGQQ